MSQSKNIELDLQDLLVSISEYSNSFQNDNKKEKSNFALINSALQKQDFSSLKTLLSTTPFFEKKLICLNTASMIDEISKGNLEKSIFHASRLFHSSSFKNYRFTNLIKLLVANSKIFSAEYYISQYESDARHERSIWEYTIAIYLAQDRFADAEKFFKNYVEPYRKEHSVLINKLSALIEQKRMKRLHIEWMQSSTKILSSRNQDGDIKKIIPVMTMPKSGTHLFRNISKQIRNVEWNIFHVYQHKPIHLENSKSVLTIRDPRAIILSLKNYINKASLQFEKDGYFESPSFDFSKFSSWDRLSEIEKLEAIVNEDSKVLPHRSKIHHISYLEASRLMQQDNVYVCKFENLAKLKSGKISEIQISELDRLLQFFEVKYKEEELANFLRNSWGNSATFHKADPYSWQHQIPTNILDKIEDKLGFFIKLWGYNV